MFNNAANLLLYYWTWTWWCRRVGCCPDKGTLWLLFFFLKFSLISGVWFAVYEWLHILQGFIGWLLATGVTSTTACVTAVCSSFINLTLNSFWTLKYLSGLAKPSWELFPRMISHTVEGSEPAGDKLFINFRNLGILGT